MQIYEERFDRDLALFDASSTLTYFRVLKKQMKDEPPAVLSIATQNLGEAKTFFPRLYASLEKALDHEHKHYELFFWGLGEKERAKWVDHKIQGPCRVFVINSQPTAHFSAGTVMDVCQGEEILLAYADMVYGFVVVSCVGK